MKVLLFGIALMLGGASCTSLERPTVTRYASDAAPTAPPLSTDILKSLFGLRDEPVPPPALDLCGGIKECVVRIRFSKPVTEDTVDTAVSHLNSAKKSGAKAIVFEIDSPGGEMDAGWTLIRTMERLGVPVHCVVDGRAQSMGFAILQGSGCITRSVTKRSRLMVHEVSGSARIERGTAKDFLDVSEDLRVATRGLLEHCAARLKISYAELRELVKDGKNLFMDHEDALRLGAVDQVVPSVASVIQSVLKPLAAPQAP